MVMTLKALATLLVLQQTASPVAAELTVWKHECDNVNGNYTINSPYKNNLDSLLSRVTTTNRNYGFYNFSSGKSPDAVNLISLCQGDVEVKTCHTCQLLVINELKSMCPNQKTAIAWSDDCMVRYSSNPIFGALEESPYFDMYSSSFASNVEQYDQVVWKLLQSLVQRASSGDSRLKFATSQAVVSPTVTVYAAAQCTPDLSLKDCLKCLDDAVTELELRGSGRGARFLFPSCSVRYEDYKFYLSTAFDFGPSFPSSTTGKKRSSAKGTIRIVVTVTLITLLLAAAMSFLVSKTLGKKSHADEDIEISYNELTNVTESLQYDFKLLQSSTNNFSNTNKLGQGGFGAVYQGKLPNGQDIAVKRLSERSSQGAAEFKNEVVLVSKLQHRNLVRLLGFCLAGEEKLLVYEFVPNKSLDYFLFDSEKQAQLDRTRRYKIIQGIGRGILYLHQDSRLRIIHRDIKPSNILLDADMTPKISDFGLAKILGLDQAQGNTKRVVGTCGYMAPEYAFNGEYSESSDVYSFGVMVLEIISGRKIKNFPKSEYPEHLMSYAWKKWKDNEPLEIMNPNLRECTESKGEVIRCIHLALLCVQEDVVARPSMSTVVMTLSCHSVALPQPRNPGFYSRAKTEMFIDSKSLPSSFNLVSISDVGPR